MEPIRKQDMHDSGHFSTHCTFYKQLHSKIKHPPPIIKNKLNLRKRLMKKMKTNPSNTLRDRIKNLNFEIKQHFHSYKSQTIRRKILPGNSKSLWDAVKIAT